MKVSDYVMQFLASIGTRHVFMLPGGGAMHLVDSLGRHEALQHICCLHEQACTIAAEAYAQYTGKPSVVLVTTGPGGTNTLTGVAAAWIDSTPMIIISGQAKTQDLMKGRGVRQMGIQEVDIVSIVSSVTKYAVTVEKPDDMPLHLSRALTEATSGRPGPVWIDIPLDIQGAIIDVSEPVGQIIAEPVTAPYVSQNAINQTVELIKGARRPVFLIGNGVRQAGALSTALEVIDNAGVPVLTTWRMSDFLPDDHPLYCGRPGIVGQRAANAIQQSADCIVLLGTRLDLCQTGFNHQNFAPRAKKVIVDIDAAEIEKLDMDFVLALKGDVGDVLKRLVSESSQLKGLHAEWTRHCRRMYEKHPVVETPLQLNDNPVNTYYLIELLSELLNENALFVPGSSGACAELTQQAFRTKKGQRMLNTPGLGSMGFGLCAAMGACLAADRKKTIGMEGDGGFQMNAQELETLRRLDLPVTMFVLNNNGYGSIRAMQQNRFDSHFVACDRQSGLTLPDVCKQAQAYGITTYRIETQARLREQLEEVLSLKGPVICEVIVDTTVQTAPRLSSEVLPDGRIVSKPMEDLWPFLSHDELHEIMFGEMKP